VLRTFRTILTFTTVALLTFFSSPYAQADSVEGTISVGTRPMEIAITSDNATAYVTNYGSSNISVIDLATNLVTNTISVGRAPWGIALSSDNSKAYVVLTDDNQVKVINLSTLTITNTISVGISPIEIALTPDGTSAFVTNFVGTVSKINLATNLVTNTINLAAGSQPRGIAINPAGTKAYTANGGGGVSEINLANNSVTNIVTTDSEIIDIVIDSDGNKAYATGYNLGNVEVIDLATSTVANRIPLSAGHTRSWGIAIEPTEKYVYVSAVSGSIEKIDTDTNLVVESIAVPSSSYYLTVNNAGTFAYLANFFGGNTVTILKLDPIIENSLASPWVGAQSITCPAPNPWVREKLGFASNAKPVLVSAENTIGKTITQGSYNALKSSGVVFDTVSTKVSTATETLPIYGCKDKLLSGKLNQPIQFIAGGYTLQSDAHGYINTADLNWHDTNGVTLYTNTAAFMHTIKFTQTGKYVVVLTEQPDTSRGLIPTYGVRSVRFVININ
jgi:YVTN family beta-propeller protein